MGGVGLMASHAGVSGGAIRVRVEIPIKNKVNAKKTKVYIFPSMDWFLPGKTSILRPRGKNNMDFPNTNFGLGGDDL